MIIIIITKKKNHFISRQRPLEEKQTNFYLYSMVNKKQNDLRIFRGGGGFWCYFRVKIGHFTWRSVASKFWVDQLILDPGLV